MNLSNPLAQLEHLVRTLANSKAEGEEKRLLNKLTMALLDIKTGAQHLEREIQEIKNRVR